MYCNEVVEQRLEAAREENGWLPEYHSISEIDTFEDKLKLLDRWIKFQTLVARQKEGGMGRGFDTDPDDND